MTPGILFNDFSQHPLLAGSLIVCLAGDNQTRRLHPHDLADLIAFNHQSFPAVLREMQNLGLIGEEQAQALTAINDRFVRAFEEVRRRAPVVALVTGTQPESVVRLARALFGSRLMAEFLQILASPTLSYEKTKEGTVDLIEALSDSLRKIVGAAWSVFFPRGDFSLIADAAGQFWVSAFYGGTPEKWRAVIAASSPGRMLTVCALWIADR